MPDDKVKYPKWHGTEGHYLNPAWHPQADPDRMTTATPDTDQSVIVPKKEK